MTRDLETVKMWSRETVHPNQIKLAALTIRLNSQKCIITLCIVSRPIDVYVIVGFFLQNRFAGKFCMESELNNVGALS